MAVAVVCILWITVIILKVSEVRCGTHDSKKLRNISLLQVNFMLVTIKKTFRKYYCKFKISKFWRCWWKFKIQKNNVKIISKNVQAHFQKYFYLNFMVVSLLRSNKKSCNFLSCWGSSKSAMCKFFFFETGNRYTSHNSDFRPIWAWWKLKLFLLTRGGYIIIKLK
jgi:hypothetical protein